MHAIHARAHAHVCVYSVVCLGVIFPISFTISYAASRRERVLLDMASFKASVIGLYQMHRGMCLLNKWVRVGSCVRVFCVCACAALYYLVERDVFGPVAYVLLRVARHRRFVLFIITVQFSRIRPLLSFFQNSLADRHVHMQIGSRRLSILRVSMLTTSAR